MPPLLDRLRRRPASAAACLLAVIALWEIGTMAWVKAAAPRDADWRNAAALVDAEFAPGDLVVFAPDWVDPVGRRWLGHRLSLDDAGRMDAASYARIWEVTVRGAAAAEIRGLGAPALEQRFGAVRVRRFEQAPARVTWRAHRGADVLEVAHHPRRCLRIMGRRDFARVELGDELAVSLGLANVWARKENRAFAVVRVSVDGKELATATVGNDSGWLALPPIATTPGVHDVSIEVTVDPARGNPGKARLEVCVAAEGRATP